MIRKLLLTLAAFLLAGAAVFGAGLAAEPATGILPVTAESPCPATGCRSGGCHGFDDVPQPDGLSEMTCPEAGCSSVECHAWDSLTTRYRQASDASLNLWLLAPAALDLLIIISFMATMVSGFMVSGAVLPALGFYAEGYRFWDPLHAMSAKALLTLILLHVIVHWKWIVHLLKKGGRHG